MSQLSPPTESSPSPSPGPLSLPRHAQTPLDRQRAQLEKLLKDPAKPAYIPPAPKDKSLRPPREMMKNVQGSSAGAGSGEFHVYKASRRREYERLKVMEEVAAKEAETLAFERKKREREEEAEVKTAKSRAKRQKKQKKRELAKLHKTSATQDPGGSDKFALGAGGGVSEKAIKKRRLVNGKEVVFKRPGEESDDDSGEDQEEGDGELPHAPVGDPGDVTGVVEQAAAVSDGHRIIIHEDD